MIQYASATARLCARRTSSQIWQMPSAVLKRHAPTGRNQGEHHIPKHTFYLQQRSLSISLDRHSRPSECRNVSKYQNSRVITDEEKVLTTIDNHSESSPGLDNETIYAKSSGPDASAIAVIRISGPACTQVNNILASACFCSHIMSRFTMPFAQTGNYHDSDMLRCGHCTIPKTRRTYLIRTQW